MELGFSTVWISITPREGKFHEQREPKRGGNLAGDGFMDFNLPDYDGSIWHRCQF